MRLLLVDDSMLVRSMMKSLIGEWEGFDIIGEASNGAAGVEMAARLKPDLILMDVNMPVMNGIEATRQIMESAPLPIIVFTSEDVSKIGYDAISAGALEVVPKPDITKMNDPVFTKGFRNVLNHVARFGALKIGTGPSRGVNRGNSGVGGIGKPFDLLVIGASTGGPSAVRKVLSDLPGNFPVPILLSQHIELGFDQGYADWLDEATDLKVSLAGESQKLTGGTVLVARATHHLVCSRGAALLDDGPAIANQKPSIDRMFLSALEEYGSRLAGVLLTGMGQDGAKGCKAIVDKGGTTLVQNQASSMIFGMPKAAIELGGASRVLSLEEIGPVLRRMAGV
ncbi:chemotaxis protein CheB [Spirochaeta isovalerica]|uniref:Protein-glutamate methylesterase/protein-glutamine glutaminase n=1 Tax=Spirochaeta isovalerica TaxID=150 RepID=A0A841RCV4_9SPIO|nr:chemotaxis protein CheB [Spirochaeta isovalerica]MBB6481835.1 two-component system chemotaxis response regulator CheB [Spirochaeta isovalerica]